MHPDWRGGGREEFPSPPGRSWLLATAHGGLGRRARASDPNLAEGREVEPWTAKQLFAALPGMRGQSWAAGVGAGAAGGGALGRRSLAQPVKGALPGKAAAPPLPRGAERQGCSASPLAGMPCTGGKIRQKSPPSWDKQTMCVKLNLCAGARAQPTPQPRCRGCGIY